MVFKDLKKSGYDFSNKFSDFKQAVLDSRIAMVNGIYVGSYYANDGKTLLLSFSEQKESEFNDIYVSFLKPDGSWTKPMSLGKNFNTSFKEDTPFLASDGVTLYFSSDRPGGLGKRDIYFSKR